MSNKITMLKRIRDYFDKRAEKKFKKYIRTVDIKLEKYKFCYGPYAEQHMQLLVSNIDFRLEYLIQHYFGIMIYINDPEVYTKVKTCKHQYCLTDNINEVKLNDLVMPPNPYVFADFICCPPRYNTAIKNIRIYKRCIDKGIRILDVNSPTLEEDVNYCREHNIKYLISVQYDLIKEFL